TPSRWGVGAFARPWPNTAGRRAPCAAKPTRSWPSAGRSRRGTSRRAVGPIPASPCGASSQVPAEGTPAGSRGEPRRGRGGGAGGRGGPRRLRWRRDVTLRAGGLRDGDARVDEENAHEPEVAIASRVVVGVVGLLGALIVLGTWPPFQSPDALPPDGAHA